MTTPEFIEWLDRTDASTLLERFAADLHGLDHDLSSKTRGTGVPGRNRLRGACTGFERGRARRMVVAASGLSAVIPSPHCNVLASCRILTSKGIRALCSSAQVGHEGWRR
jgi:hypothetical protein